MARSIPVAALLLAACGGKVRLPGLDLRGPALSYAQYKSLEPGMSARAILDSFGAPLHAMEHEGKVRGLTYRCEDSTGQVQELRMVFSTEEKLEKWALRAPGEKGPQAGAA